MRLFSICAAALLLGLLGASPTHAQHVEGCVTDAERGRPLPGAHVAGPSGRGAVADSTGCFTLALPPGTHALTAQMLGYGEQTTRVTLASDAPVRRDFRLTPEALPLKQLEVIAARSRPTVSTPPLTTLGPAEARALPGTSEDVMRALQATPGVVSTSDFSSQLVVRGSRPDENLIVIDGVEVFNPHRLHGVVSVFNPELLAGAELYAGGFPARYGDRLSAVLDVKTRAGTSQERLRGTVNTSLANANLVFEGRTGFWEGTWIVAGRRTYYDLLLGLIDPELGGSERMTLPNFADAQGKLVLQPAPAHAIEAGLIAGRDALDVTMGGDGTPFTAAADRMQTDDVSRNDVAYLRWRWTPSDALRATTTASGYRNRGTARSGGQLVPRDRLAAGEVMASLDTTNVFAFDVDRRFRFRKWSLHQTLAWESERHALEGGLGVDALQTGLAYDLAVDDVGQRYLDVLRHTQPLGLDLLPGAADRAASYSRTFAYVQDRVPLFDARLTLTSGLRIDHYGLSGRTHLAPRFDARLELTPTTTLRAAGGRHRQSPGFEKMLMSREALGFSDETDLGTLRPERATHYVAGVAQRIAERYTLRADAYLKTMRDLIAPAWTPTSQMSARYTGAASRTDPAGYALERDTTWQRTNRLTNDGRGRAYGLEATVRKQRRHEDDRLTGWIAYAYARSIRSQVIDAEGGQRVAHPFAYDRPHTLRAVVNMQVGARWTLGASFRYGSGFPHTAPENHTAVVVERADGGAELLTHSETGAVRFQPTFGGPEHRYDSRLPAYHRLDLRLTRAFDGLGRGGWLYLDVMNVYDRRNVLSYQYAAVADPAEVRPVVYQQSIYMLPLVPSLGFSVAF